METDRPGGKSVTITANLIEQRLREKHCSDIFVSQCKTGGSWSGTFQILDAWAMIKSWAHPRAIGYEIKVDRQDFLNDNKWPGYLPFCNEFYFVTPPKLVVPEEVPEDVGLLWLSTTGNRFYTKKKAKYRKAEKLESLYKYILISRTKITKSSMYAIEEDPLAYWKNWLAKRDEEKELGHNVSHKIQLLVQQRITNVENQNFTLKSQNEDLEGIKKFVKDLGFKIDGYWWGHKIKNHIKNLTRLIDPPAESAIRSLQRSINEVIEILDEAKKGPENGS